jgi:hypothetical protein
VINTTLPAMPSKLDTVCMLLFLIKLPSDELPTVNGLHELF